MHPVVFHEPLDHLVNQGFAGRPLSCAASAPTIPSQATTIKDHRMSALQPLEKFDQLPVVQVVQARSKHLRSGRIFHQRVQYFLQLIL